ncbi:MAG TPA: zinc-ribbon domain-containing protein, partial [Arthrobacter sp.]
MSTSTLPVPVHPLSVPKAGRSLAERFPDIAATWDYERNHPITPSNVTARSNRKAWFICPEHGSWEAYISNRTAGNGCRPCGRMAIGRAHRQQAVARGTLADLRPDVAAQ